MFNIFTFFKKKVLESEPFDPGALMDIRTEKEKDEDYHISEIVATNYAVTWKEIDKDKVRKFPVQNQGYKSDCVAETRRKLYRIICAVNNGYDLDFSAVDLYRRRSNYPLSGMLASNAIDLCRKQGMTLEALEPSDIIKTEEEANRLIIKPYNKDIALKFTIPNEVTFTAGDIDTVAGTIQKTRKGVMTWFYFTAAEWSQEVPQILDYSLVPTHDRAIRHSVTAVEACTYNGKEGLWIEDSAHFGGINRRFITREFYEKRNFWASYPITFVFLQQDTRPKYDGSIKSLQDCLKFSKFFPSNVDSTGYFGNITKTALKEFQKSVGLSVTGELDTDTDSRLRAACA